MDKPPPIHTETLELIDWTLRRTADLPKSQRFTFGQRIDGLSLDAIELLTRARFSQASERGAYLDALNLKLELLRVLWRIVQKRGWISSRQLIHVIGRIDTIGKMAGAWRRKAG